MSTLLIIIVIFLLFGGITTFPTWNHSADWGYGPSGGIGTVLAIVLILYLVGVLR